MHYAINAKGNRGIWTILYLKSRRLYFHIPTFFLMSFYFTQKTLSSSNYKKKFKRFERLCIPYFLWPIIIYFLNKLLIKYSITQNVITKQDLKIQLLYGGGKMNLSVMWYQWDLIFLTICFNLITFIFRKHYNFVLIIIAITCYIYQYNGKNVLYFYKYKDYRQYIYGRVMELAPLSVIGFFISSSGIINYFRKFRLEVIFSCIYLLYFLYNYEIFNNVKGYYYSGMLLFFSPICIFFAFAMFPSEKLNYWIIQKIIKQLTNYTAGVYFLHLLVYYHFSQYIIQSKNKTLK
jgi:fucose 4-O-acetylase-like acetyltransferase